MEERKIVKLPAIFPPLSTILLLAFSIFFLFDGVLYSSEKFSSLVSYLSAHPLKPTIAPSIFLFIALDFYWFLIRRKKLKALFKHKTDELETAWRLKAKQQERANTYSGQTDKLKGFISDKLLEFIEYDEKFVHFKGIAAEVRHNGVISYDKVTTALKKAVEQQGFLAMYEDRESDNDNQNSHTPSPHTLDSLSLYQNAQDAMEYLWALLDLSTADNMALHIGKQLIECEEHYFQLHLDAKKEMDITQSIPISPTFYPQLALLLTLSLQIEEPEIRKIISLSRINHKILEEAFYFENELFRIKMLPVSELLGNPNHIILLLENLIKNALFFQRKAAIKQSSDRVIVTMMPSEGNAKFTIYNRGPQIEEEDLPQIFDLGFSTRRNRQDNGKGLGLFFSKQIVDGYQGKISVRNVEENKASLRIKVELASGECKEFSYAHNEDEERLAAKEEFDCPIVRVDTELDNHNNSIHLQEIDEIKGNIKQDELICNAGNIPCWKLSISSTNKAATLKATPLKTGGVEFSVEIPTAESLLED